MTIDTYMCLFSKEILVITLIMLPYILAILFLQHEEVDLLKIISTPELIDDLGVKWITMLRRVVGYEEEFILELEVFSCFYI